MKKVLYNESGATLASILKSTVAVAVVLTVLWLVGRFFVQVLFTDSAAEETIKELSGRAISASSRLLSGQKNLTNDEYGNLTSRGYPAATYTIDDSFFEITISNVPKSVCKGLINRGWTLPTSLYVNGQLNHRDIRACGSLNQLSFEFSRDLNDNISNADKPFKKHCRSDSDCAGCEACRNGLCQTGCQAGESCGQTIKGKDVCCSKANIVDSMCCSYIQDDACCWGRGKCCPKDRPIYLDDDTCTDCYDSRVFAVGDPPSVQACLWMCPNRVPFGADEMCMLPLCQSGYFTDRTGACIPCDQAGGYATSQSECAKCPNRQFQEDGFCVLPCPEGTIRDSHNQCVPCDTPITITLDNPQSCAQTCPNRRETPAGCIPTLCPGGFVPDNDGNCLDCQSPEPLTNISEAYCHQCPNRIFENDRCVYPCPESSFRDRDGHCVSCQSPSAIPVPPDHQECQKCPERLALNGYCFAACTAGQFRDAFGACHSCSDLSSYPVFQTAVCSVCSNRSIFLHQVGNRVVPYCMPQYCPLDYFMDKFGSCHDCFDTDTISNTAQAECEKCSNRRWSPVGKTCQVKPECKPDEVPDDQGQCQSCSSDEEAISVRGYPEDCARCTNRYLFGTWCRKCPENIGAHTDRDGCQKCGGKWDNRTRECS